MNTHQYQIYHMAIEHVIEMSKKYRGESVTYHIIESEPNKAGGITHNARFKLGSAQFEVEVYEQNGILTDADCWAWNPPEALGVPANLMRTP